MLSQNSIQRDPEPNYFQNPFFNFEPIWQLGQSGQCPKVSTIDQANKELRLFQKKFGDFISVTVDF